MLAGTGAAATYAIGKVFVKHFEAGGTIENFSRGGGVRRPAEGIRRLLPQDRARQACRYLTTRSPIMIGLLLGLLYRGLSAWVGWVRADTRDRLSRVLSFYRCS
ncbi:MAG: hypothetical protein WDN49_18660 [Acetobacteraceae bacterium]